MAVHPRIILGWPSYLGILGTSTRGDMTVHLGKIPGCPSYSGIPRYLDKGEGHMAVHHGIIPG